MQTSIASALFTSSQQRVLGLLYGRADQSFYTNEIVRLAGMGTGAVHRELKKLAAAGLLTETKIGNQARYQANPDTPVFTELRGLIVKTFGVADHLRQALAPVANQIGVAVIYGSMARGTEDVDSDVDLLLITDALAYGDVFPLLSDAETALGRPVNPSIYGRAEWERKQHEGNSFVTRLLEQPKIFLIGTESDLAKSS
jgi:predicted nucleotidyltransferase